LIGALPLREEVIATDRTVLPLFFRTLYELECKERNRIRLEWDEALSKTVLPLISVEVKPSECLLGASMAGSGQPEDSSRKRSYFEMSNDKQANGDSKFCKQSYACSSSDSDASSLQASVD